jgi:hypothetical protein
MFRWNYGQRHYSGSYWSSTMSAHIIYESRLDLARLLVADFDESVLRTRKLDGASVGEAIHYAQGAEPLVRAAADRARLWGLGAHHPPRGGAGQAGLARRAAGAPAVGAEAGR